MSFRTKGVSVILIFLVMNSPLQIHKFKYVPLKNLGLNIREHKVDSVYKICQEIKRNNSADCKISS